MFSLRARVPVGVHLFANECPFCDSAAPVGHYSHPDPVAEQEWKKCVSSLQACVQLWECMCVGPCQETAELSGMRCRLHSLALGGSIMRATQGCLSVGEWFSTFSIYIYIHIYSQCVSGSLSLQLPRGKWLVGLQLWLWGTSPKIHNETTFNSRLDGN